MSSSMADNVKSLLNLPKSNQDQVFRQFARFEKPERIAVLEKHRKMLFRLKNESLPFSITEISYVALLFAIVQYTEERKKHARLNYDGLSLEEIGELAAYEARIYQAKHERPSPKTEEVMKRWGTVVYLKNKGFSFRDIAGVLEDRHSIKVSVPTLSRTWKKLQKLEELTEIQ